MALALRIGAGEDRRAPRAVKTHLGAFEPGGRGTLDGVGYAEAAKLALLARLRLAQLEAFDVGHLEREIHVLFELAAVVGEC